jgi:type I restriction enzyme, R subunit
VNKVARELLATLKAEKLVLDWRKRQQSRAAVWVAIEEHVDKLPPTYTTEVYTVKCNTAY